MPDGVVATPLTSKLPGIKVHVTQSQTVRWFANARRLCKKRMSPIVSDDFGCTRDGLGPDLCKTRCPPLAYTWRPSSRSAENRHAGHNVFTKSGPRPARAHPKSSESYREHRLFVQAASSRKPIHNVCTAVQTKSVLLDFCWWAIVRLCARMLNITSVCDSGPAVYHGTKFIS